MPLAMIGISTILPAGTWDPKLEIDQVLIDYDSRFRRRIVLTTVSGTEVLIDLAEAVRLRDGDGLVTASGGVICVRAQPNRCLRFTPTTKENSSALPGTSATAICRCNCSAIASASAPTTSSRRWSRDLAVMSMRLKPRSILRPVLMRVAATVTPTATMPEGAGWRSATCGDDMEAPRALLRLMAWLSPAFPTGAFAYSHGLEWAVEVR